MWTRTAAPNKPLGDEILAYLNRTAYALVGANNVVGRTAQGYNGSTAWILAEEADNVLELAVHFKKSQLRCSIHWREKGLDGSALIPLGKALEMTSGQLAKELRRRVQA